MTAYFDFKTYKTLAFVFFFELTAHIVNADYVATLSGCPGSYQRIANGCYFIVNSTTYDQATAYSMCAVNYTATSPIVTHLLSFESQAESIAILIWFKGFGYTNDFWSDGTMNSANIRVWSWSQQDYANLGYVQDSGLTKMSNSMYTARKYMYLKYNGSSSYEFYDDTGKTKMGFVCEAQVPCYSSDNVCLNNGTCWVNNGRVLCTCQPGYEGTLCEVLIDNCDSVPCQHGGGCTNQVNNYTCNCTEYYTGRNCETLLNLKALPYPYESAITAVLTLALTIVGILIIVLCLLDLPWDDFVMVWRRRKAAQKQKEMTKAMSTLDNANMDNDRSRMPTKAQLLASEQEMLRRFRSALEQTKRAPSSRARTNL